MLNLLISSILTIVLFNNVEGQSPCTTPRQQPGTCIKLNQCNELYNLIRNGKLKDEQVEFLRKSQCGQVEGSVLVCCPTGIPVQRQKPRPVVPLQLHVQQQQPRPNGQPQFQQQRPQASIPFQQQQFRPNIPKQNQKPIQQNLINSGLFPKPGVCGKGAENRVYGGSETKLGEYPWVALVGWDSRNGDGSKGFHCGGSLINNRYILTAAHCIKSASLPAHWRVSTVRLGEWNTDTERDCTKDISGYVDCADPAIDIPIESITIHENYDGASKEQYNDIALLRLSKNVPYTSYISPVCLPFNELRSSTLEGHKFDVVGWGRTEVKTKSSVKLKALVDTFDLTRCNQVYERSAIELKSGQLCAGGVKGIDSCNGDSGGPLIGKDNTNKKLPNYFLAGIVSFGTTLCGTEGWPGVYTRVGAYIDWIQDNVKP